ncbi:tRNA (N6-threonylcarbamoyladenosine(37)-N6)-methyltransferase TrmO [Draconibacterium orientale]|uniref:tRNA (N6-threonylcarbamoyladenosine(37)-N6)-methyltransferase TrmO n=1 Tax=Draconibacterium orientale TaxID=1168034 RepID=UPI002A0A4A76|nr:tRNA (N6-threonylcarbamoyladenosine(37)-N6)-methyltransferase TrmO [Draconibacterium orientale]
MEDIVFHPIGIIHSEYKHTKDTPIQPASGMGTSGSVEILPEYVDGLQDIGGFSHLILIYHFNRSPGYKLKVKPFLDKNLHGVFSTRTPFRPNPIGLSVVKLNSRNKNILEIENIDILDGTPLFDIKPFIPDFDAVENVKIGRVTKSRDKISNTLNDGRFESESKIINQK